MPQIDAENVAESQAQLALGETSDGAADQQANARIQDPSLTGIDQFLAEQIERRPLPENLKKAVSYALFGGGKRLRPKLVLMACEAVGGKTEEAIAAAAAIELVHCFSLVHDDLPAMDDSDLRRGRPTLHKHTSDAMAVLAGDLMLAMAFEVLSTNVCDRDRCAALVRELSIATNDMIAGQVYDTLPSKCHDQDDEDADDLDRLERTHKHKTGAMIRAACRMGAIAGGCAVSQLTALTAYGESIGLMFQIVDDVLDVTSDAETLGKQVNQDAEAGKLTYPAVLGLETSQDEIERYRLEARQALDDAEIQADDLMDLADWLAQRSS